MKLICLRFCGWFAFERTYFSKAILMAQISPQPPSGGVAPPVMGALAEPGDAATQADRVAAETLIRSTVQVLASGSAIRDLDGLVQRNVGNVSHADIRAGRLGSNVLGDIISTVEQAKGGAPFNWNAASPQQISAYLASKGIATGGHTEGPRTAAQGEGAASDRQVTSGSYARELGSGTDHAFLKSVGLNDATGRALAAMGFTTPEQVRQVVHDANTLGLAPSAAALDLGRLRKAEGARTNQHVAALKQYGDDLHALDAEKREIAKINDPKERAERMRAHEERVRQREERLKAYRDGNVQTPDGKKSFDRVRDKIRAKSEQRVELEGPAQANFGEAHSARANDAERLAVAQQVEANHRTTVAEVAAAPSARDDIKARLARRAQTQTQTEGDPLTRLTTVVQPAAATAAPATPAAKGEGAKPAGEQTKAPEQRQAANTKALKLTV
jgi:hypothetical protein